MDITAAIEALSIGIRRDLESSPPEEFSLTLGRVEGTQDGGLAVYFEVDRTMSPGDSALIGRVNRAVSAAMASEGTLRAFAVEITVDTVIPAAVGDG